jgi:amino acid transporter
MAASASAARPGDDAALHENVTRRRRSLSWYHLVGVTFFAVCGGDYGLEDSVGAAGPAFTLCGLLLLPWLWSLPIALMTAELGSMIPETGGYVIWIQRAFGPFWAHQNALWNLVSNAFHNALYPVMFVDYLRYFPGMRFEGLQRWLVSVTMLTWAARMRRLSWAGSGA